MKLGIQIGAMAIDWRDKGATEEAQSCDAAIEMTGAIGLQGLEVFERHIMDYYEKPEYMKEILGKAGVALTGAYFHLNAALTDGAAELQRARKACEFMSRVNGEYLVLNGGPPYDAGNTYTPGDYKTMAQVANSIGEIGASHGVSVVMHPHFKFMVETNDNLEAALAAGLDPGKVGLCVHASHQVLAGSDPYAMYERHADLVTYVHVGNGKLQGDKHVGTLLGEGDLDQKRLMNPLLDAGFDGWIIIECSQDGISTKDYAANTLEYLKTSFTGISWGE